MTDRLQDLQRQRALAEEQLAWINREIAKEIGQTSAPAAQPAALPVTPAPAAINPVAAAEAARMADEIIARYHGKDGDAQITRSDVRRGCFLYFALAMLLLGAGVAALYLYSHSQH